LIDSSNGKGASFSSTEILGVNQSRVFTHVWKNAIKTNSLEDMTKAEAQEIYRIIKIINENALGYMLDSKIGSKQNEDDLFNLLEKNGISLKEKSIDEVIEIIDAALQIMCSGHADFDGKTKSISIESKMNSGHSLPWVSILDGYLHKIGYKTRLAYQNQAHKGEKVHLKFTK
jgi:hypothetical protein